MPKLRAPLLILLFVLRTLSFAQQPASVTIAVTDPSGAAIARAHVTIIPEALPKKVETDEKGLVTATLPPGQYEATVGGQGFRTTTKSFVVQGNASQSVPVVLRIGSCPPGPCLDVTPDPADERAVWKLEHSYWEYVQASDLEGYRTLWHPDFLGWPYVSPSPVRKDHITDWITDYRSRGLHLESFDLRPAESRAEGDTVVVFYSITAHWVDKNGKGKPATSRITHTWVRSTNGWQIISGMSAAVSGVNK